VAQFKDFVKNCHEHGIAVLVDVVYNHMVQGNLLTNWGGYSSEEYPNGIYFNDAAHGGSPWGPRPDIGRPQVADLLEQNSLMFLRDYDCDGLRWDSVANLRSFNENDIAHNLNLAGIRLIQKSNDEYRKTGPTKIVIAEDLHQDDAFDTQPIAQGGLGFNTQWDDTICTIVRKAVAGADTSRNLTAVGSVITRKIGPNPFARVIYTEDHDQVGHPTDRRQGVPQIRVPAFIDPQDPQSIKAKRRSTLAAAIILTSPGVPMLFQGQEMLDPNTFLWGVFVPINWTRVDSMSGIVKMYHDMIALRRNRDGKTAGLEGGNTSVFHIDQQNHTLAYRRWDKGGAGDDVIVVANFSAAAIPALSLGFPGPGKWTVRFNSGSSIYDPQFKDGETSDVTAVQAAADGLAYSGHLAIGPYSVIVLSQD
jgi:1,4-alpha-glucan branching enzyme